MGLFSIFKRPGGAAPAAAAGDAALAVDSARMRARRRLIGAVVLLGIGVIAFPLLFETQPRPIPVDIAIEIPRKEGAPALVVPPPRPAATAASKPVGVLPVITESKADAGKAVAPAPPPPPKPEVAAKPDAPKVEARGATPPASSPPSRLDKTEAPLAEAKGRFVVQIGAFADAAVARETRAKVEKLGLRTYTQAVETDNGKRTRVRLGPYGSRDEAEAAAAKVKAAGLPAAVLTL